MFIPSTQNYLLVIAIHRGALKDTIKKGHLLALGVEVLDQILKQIHSLFNLDFIDLQQILLRNKGKRLQKSGDGMTSGALVKQGHL